MQACNGGGVHSAHTAAMNEARLPDTVPTLDSCSTSASNAPAMPDYHAAVHRLSCSSTTAVLGANLPSPLSITSALSANPTTRLQPQAQLKAGWHSTNAQHTCQFYFLHPRRTTPCALAFISSFQPYSPHSCIPHTRSHLQGNTTPLQSAEEADLHLLLRCSNAVASGAQESPNNRSTTTWEAPCNAAHLCSYCAGTML